MNTIKERAMNVSGIGVGLGVGLGLGLRMSIYYNEDSMANILAFADVAFIPGVKITMDT